MSEFHKALITVLSLIVLITIIILFRNESKNRIEQEKAGVKLVSDDEVFIRLERGNSITIYRSNSGKYYTGGLMIKDASEYE